MVQKKLPLINSAHGSETRNIINELIKLFNGMGYTYNESLKMSREILEESQKTNDMNKNVQRQINTLIAESGTSDAEVVQARIDSEGNEYDVLKTRLDEKEQNFSAQLEKTATDLEGRGTNVKLLGVKGDGVTDDTSILQNIINSNAKTIVIPDGQYIISDTIIIPENKEVVFEEGATIRMTNLNKHAIQVKNRAKLRKPRIILDDGHTGAGIYLTGVDKIETDTTIKDVFIRGGGPQSTGILLESVGNSQYVYYTSFDTVYVEHCGTAIHLKRDNEFTGYVNSNIFTNIIIYQCGYHFHLEGNVQANMFEDFNCQWTRSVVPTVYGAYCEGRDNTFNGRFWDFKEGSKAYYFTESSSYNLVYNNIYLERNEYVDLGLYNHTFQIFRDQRNNMIMHPNVNQQGFLHSDSGYFQNPITYAGNQDDALAYADKRFTVENKGLPITGGNFSRLFDPHTGRADGVYYKKPTPENPVIIEINFGSNPLENVPFIGFAFSQRMIAEDFTVETASTSEGGYGTPQVITGNNNSNYTVLFGRGNITTILGKVRITITKAMSADGINTNELINIRRIFAPSAAQQGHTYLPRSGGKMYGSLEFSGTDGAILQSPDGSRWKQTINNDGETSWVKL